MMWFLGSLLIFRCVRVIAFYMRVSAHKLATFAVVVHVVRSLNLSGSGDALLNTRIWGQSVRAPSHIFNGNPHLLTCCILARVLPCSWSTYSRAYLPS